MLRLDAHGFREAGECLLVGFLVYGTLESPRQRELQHHRPCAREELHLKVLVSAVGVEIPAGASVRLSVTR